MATSKECLARASQELGYCRWDDPKTGTKYGRWYAELTKSPYFGTNGVPFCAMGVSYIMDAIEQACAGLPTASVPTLNSGASKAGIIIPDKRKAVPGDIVIFDWSNVAGPNDHVGFVEINYGSSGLQTIEFNTTGPDGRSGSVARKVRSWDSVQCIVRPPWSPGATGGIEDYLPGKLAEDGYWGRATIIALQVYFGTPVDGIVSSQDPYWESRNPGLGTGWEWGAGVLGSQLINAMQGVLGVKRDGLIGPDTINALIKRFMGTSGATELDGKLDGPSVTIKAMQKALNAGKF